MLDLALLIATTLTPVGVGLAPSAPQPALSAGESNVQPAAPVAVQDDEDEEQPPLDEEAVEALVEKLEELLPDKKGSPEDKVDLIWEAVEFAHEDVVEALEEGLDDKQHDVRLATLDVLGLIEHEDAMKVLAKLAKRDKKLQEDEDLAAQLYKSLGRYGDKKNASLLTKNIFATAGDKVVQARLMSLGKIREKDSVEELIGLMNSAGGGIGKNGNGGGGGGRANPAHMETVRLALYALLEEDAGNKRDDWQKWWNDNKRSFEVTEEEPELEGQLGKRWNRYWSTDTRAKDKDDEEEDEGGRGGGRG